MKILATTPLSLFRNANTCRLLSYSAIALTVACGASRPRGSIVKIVGGEAVESAEDKRSLASTVALMVTIDQDIKFEGKNLKGTNLVQCTGTLIGPNHIVTAAHCATLTPEAKIWKIGWGSAPRKAIESIKVTNVSYHKKWLKDAKTITPATLPNDIGVFSIEGKLPDGMIPVSLASPDEVQVGTPLLLAGYGATKEGEVNLEPVLRQVRTEVESLDKKVRKLGIKTYTGKGAASGDSGGPAYLDSNGILKLIGATHGWSEGLENVAADVGQGSYVMVNLFQGWMKCQFESHGNPLSTLIDDDSSADCDNANLYTNTINSPQSTSTSAPSTAVLPYGSPGCSYADASKYDGYGWNASSSKSCAPAAR
ncbi:MAG: S1 family peptidase [Deltaproteobacteria bacterium]|nr:S1 family peptidase [Deltaproteobacteria bacterium]